MLRAFSLGLAASALLSTSAFAEPVRYELDASHSQVVFTWNHLGYSETTGMFSGFEGEIMFDEESPENSSVSVEIPASSLLTGWEERAEHLKGEDFFGAEANPAITFESTSIETTGDNTANITGDLTLNGVTKPVTLETTLNNSGDYPMGGGKALGFNATTTINRSEWDMGKFAPNVSDEVDLRISVEAKAAEGE
ncbi:YceI family protein [Notoacmeibacter ruber]|uniref:Polyisoprenoid-binding protein n=1 Tax=Notoacmeibacter ruber TaxID=2670375 RepID=A0A3L7J9T0_9HYPH|nr:YceI family protein [Notoacmeibacter ruber]RLQ87508.1 polyisoprenoid-binding protein [Notoacmeibacter ruber]